MNKIEKVHERALGPLYNDSTFFYADIISMARKSTMKISRNRILCIEIYETVSKLNPPLKQWNGQLAAVIFVACDHIHIKFI